MKRNDVNNLIHLEKVLCDDSNQFYLYGTGKTGEEFYRQINERIKIIGFIESEPVEPQKLGLPIYKWEEIGSKLNEKTIIIITIRTARFRDEVEKQLLQSSLVRNVDYFFYDVAGRIITFCKDKIFWVSQIDLTITAACTLKCRDCIQQIPLIKGKRNISYQEIIESLEDTFCYIDYCEEFHIVGGEPLLHPQLPQIVEYTGIHYKEKIGTIVIVTNGTILPDKELLDALCSWNVRVEISDYRKSETSPEGQKIEDILAEFDEYNISYFLRPMAEWNDYCGDRGGFRLAPLEDALIETFDTCPCAGSTLSIQGKKAYICSRSSVAETFGLVDKDPQNGISLCGDVHRVKEKLLELSIKITESGYIPYCVNCYGEKPIYERIVPAAKQMR